MSSAKYKTLNAAASFAKLIALRRFVTVKTKDGWTHMGQ